MFHRSLCKNGYRWMALALLLQWGTNANAASRNVLFIAVDDLKPTVGCYGDALAKTPNLDRLAARGTLFERAYCMQAVCSPSRNAVLTGLRPQTLRIYDLATNFRRSVPDVVTLPQHFKSLGYRSEGIGKIFHVGHGNSDDKASWSVPHYSGKTIQYVLPENRHEVSREEALFANKPAKKSRRLPKGAPTESADVSDNTYSDGQIADEAIRRLEKAKANPHQPFFLAVGFLKPHLPFCAPTRYWQMHDPKALPLPDFTTPPKNAPPFAPTQWGELRNYMGIPEKGDLDEATVRHLIHGYYAATSFMDAQLGRVLDALDRLGLAENTIVVLWGDHGWHLGDHGMWCKHTNYEQATRAPLLFVAPGLPEGMRSKHIVEFVDIYPTLCDLTKVPRPTHLQGESLVQILKGEEPEESGTALQVYPRSSPEGRLLGQALRTDRWRYVEWQKENGDVVARELYDLSNDPGETVNQAEDPSLANVVSEHAAQIRAQLAKPHPAGLRMRPRVQ